MRITAHNTPSTLQNPPGYQVSRLLAGLPPNRNQRVLQLLAFPLLSLGQEGWGILISSLAHGTHTLFAAVVLAVSVKRPFTGNTGAGHA